MHKVELKDFLEYQYLSQPQFAPNGKAAAFVVSYANEEENKYQGNIWIYEKGAVKQLTGLENERSFFWEDDTHILFPAVRSEAEKKKQKDKEEFTTYYRIDIHGGEALPAFTLPLQVNKMERIEGDKYLVYATVDVKYPEYYKMRDEEKKNVAKEREEDQDYYVLDETPFWFNGAGFVNKNRSSLFLFDSKRNELERITPPLMEVDSYCLMHQKVYFSASAFQCKRPMRTELYVYDYKTGKTDCLYEKMEYLFAGFQKFQDDVLVFATKGERYGLNENNFVYRLNQETGDLELLNDYRQSMYSSVGTDCQLGGGDGMGVGNDRLYFITTLRNASHIYTMDHEGHMAPFVTEEGSVDCLAVSEATGDCLFVGMQKQKLQELYLADAEGKVKQLTHFNEKVLENKYVAVPEKMTILSHDVEIDGWVLKPKDFDEDKKYPAIFDIHGGPKTVYGEVFFHEMQYWANNGYFVFFCNPTGSDGRGNDFADIRGKYGTIDYENLMDFMDAVLKKYPQINPKRVGETGGSYGGFMTNWIVGHTDRFACAATQRSISNWLSFQGVSDIGAEFATDQTAADLFSDPEKMWWHSPLKYADQVTTPLLFIHSDEDHRCPWEQAVQFYSALANQGNLVRMCCFKGENHELSRSGKPKHRVRRLEEITKWMDKFLKR